MYNQQKLRELLDEYKGILAERWPDEDYKLEAVKHFQDKWDINATDFYSMLDDALSKTDNLLVNRNFFPRGMIIGFTNKEPETVREMFKDLYDESKQLTTRLNKFIEKSEEIRAKYQSIEPGWINHYQTYNSVSTYLWLKYPDKYYIYKYSELKAFCKRIENDFVPHQGEKYREDNITKGFALWDELSNILKNEKEIVDIYKSVKSKDFYEDDKLKSLAFDISRYVYVTDVKEPKKAEKAAKVDNTENESNVNLEAPKNYWWLNANPKVWSFSDYRIDEEQGYTFYNENGNPRKHQKNFQNAKVGDVIIGYETSPVKKITGLAKISKIIPGESLYFKKTESLVDPIDYLTLKQIDELKNMEYFVNPNGSLFSLTEVEYTTIMDLIRETNVRKSEEKPDEYNKKMFTDEVYMDSEDYDELALLVREKKNIVLKGAPGVGKTFAARRLAYSLMGEKDKSRVKVVQFHQSYSYEDFVMGYKPADGKFVLKTGVFYDFCTEASNDPDRDYFFIIDEINRGNLSKIFGELLMLIENDKRGGKEYVSLAYMDKMFTVPDNLYIIGMMNTADRSLTKIDYALRRRFSFYDMEPAFDSVGFKQYQKEINDETFDAIIEKIKSINKKISDDDSLGAGYRIGHSYFCNLKGKCNEARLSSIINYDIIPLLEEYWFDNKQELESAKKILTEVF